MKNTKTKLYFTNCTFDKRVAILKYPNGFSITREKRKNHLMQNNEQGEIQNTDYIVINVPKELVPNISVLDLNGREASNIGFTINDKENFYELLFYDELTFCWNLHKLKNIGIKVSQRMIPTEHDNDLFHFYINANGIKELSYNIFFTIFQLPFSIYKVRKLKKQGLW